MQTNGHISPARDLQDSKATFATQMTNFEIVQCGRCRHEWVRPRGRTLTLPCGKCLSVDLTISSLLAAPATAVKAVTV